MPKILIVLLLVFLAFCVDRSIAQYSLSSRVGVEIDRNERDYFGLFPGVQGFVSAKASRNPDNHVAITISREKSGIISDTTFTISSTLAENIGLYIEDFESYRSKDRTVHWEILGGLAWGGPALESAINQGKSVKIVTRKGENLEGKLLWADDSSLVLSRSSEKYSWRLLQYSEETLWFSDIENITIEQKSAFGTGFAIGAPIGAAAGVLFAVALSEAFSSRIDVAAVVAFGLGTGVVTGLLGGLIGAIASNDTYREISGDPYRYSELLPDLNESSVFPSYPPPDLLRFITTSLPPKAKQIPLAQNGDTTNVTSNTVAGRMISSHPMPVISYLLYGECATSFSSVCFSANYERQLSRYFWLRLGFGFSEADNIDGSGFSGEGWGPMVMVSFLSGATHKLEFGLGASIMSTPIGRYNYDYNINISQEWRLHPAIALGYRYQPAQGGLVFRIGLGYDYYEGVPLYISLGSAF